MRKAIFIQFLQTKIAKNGQTLVELLLVIGLAAIILPALLYAFSASREGRAQQERRQFAVDLLKTSQEAVRSIREKGWVNISANGTYHPVVSGSSWAFGSGPDVTDGFTRQIVITDVYRNAAGQIASSSGTLDPSTKKVDITITWNEPLATSIATTLYISRYLDNLSHVQTTLADFTANTNVQTKVTDTSGGEATLADNTKAKWCSPEFSSATIDLPDGPPVAVTATSNSSSSIPNDAFVATAPTATSSVKLAYINVAANADPPVSTLKGTFTLDGTKFSDGSLVPTGIGIDNDFRTNDVRYYRSSSNKLYALIATTKPDKEVIAILVDDNDPTNDNTTAGEYQDPVNKIYKYWTYFNTRPYNTSAGLQTGYRDPSANASDTGGDGNGYVSNPTRAYTSNNSYAVDTDSGNGTGTSCTGSDKDKHRFYNYGFSLPSGAAVNGIEVRLDGRVDSTSGTPRFCVQLSWNGGTTWTTAQTSANLNTSDQTLTLGGAADNWGRTWSDTELTNANFRVRIINVASNTSRDFSLDWVGVNVHYSGGATSQNDQSPFTYGGTTLTVLSDRGYVASGGYLYVFDLANIDSKSTSDQIDQVGCRIQLSGYECSPGVGQNRKYSLGQTGTSYGDTPNPTHNDCSDGGNIERYAANDLYGVEAGGSSYIFSAVGAGTNPELEIVNATSIPTSGTTPAINDSTCGALSGGNASWKVVGTYDFNSDSGTEEAANSVYAKSDGTRAYISSNGGIDGDGDGQGDSKQFYIINTTNKTSPAFLSGNPSTGPTSGFYTGGIITPTPAGSTYHNAEMYPRRSLTVLNGQRVVLVGSDGLANSNDPEDYQVLNSTNESTITYCGGLDFDAGFNDLTSVTEADLDNYVYMVANTTVNELKIIQGGPDGAYLDTGNMVSTAIDAGYTTAFNSYAATVSKPSGTDVQFQFAGADAVAGSCAGATYIFTGPNGATDTYYTATTSAITLNDDGLGYENPARCFKYKTYFSTTNFNTTPVLSDMTINYSP